MDHIQWMPHSAFRALLSHSVAYWSRWWRYW